MNNQELVRKAFNKKLNLDELLDEAGLTEDVTVQLRDMKTEAQSLAVAEVDKGSKTKLGDSMRPFKQDCNCCGKKTTEEVALRSVRLA